MDITVQVAARRSKAILSAFDAAIAVQPGDPINVYLSQDVAKNNSGIYNCNFRIRPQEAVYYIHIKDLPALAIKRIKNALLNGVLADIAGIKTKVRSRKWAFKFNLLTTAARNRLKTNGEVTVSWVIAKNYIRKRVIIDIADSTKDTETELIADVDLERG